MIITCKLMLVLLLSDLGLIWIIFTYHAKKELFVLLLACSITDWWPFLSVYLNDSCYCSSFFISILVKTHVTYLIIYVISVQYMENECCCQFLYQFNYLSAKLWMIALPTRSHIVCNANDNHTSFGHK